MDSELKGAHVLVLTHTDVRKDNRIIRAIEATLALPGVSVLALGRRSEEEWVISEGPRDRFSLVQLPARKRRKRALGLGRWMWKILSRGRVHFGVARAWTLVVFWVTFFIGNFLFFTLAIANLRGLRPSIVYCHDEYLLPAGVLIKKLFGSRLIYDAHELEHDKNGQSRVVKEATFRLEMKAWGHVDYFVTVSEAIRNHYLRVLGEKPSTVIVNSPSISQKVCQSGLRQDLGLDSSAVLLVYVGSLTEGRGIRFLIQISSALPESWHLAFVGDGPLKDLVENACSSNPRVHRLGAVRHDLLVSYISSASVGMCLAEPVSLSDQLALPNKFFEYAFAGLPIVFTEAPEMIRLGRLLGNGKKTSLEADQFIAKVSQAIHMKSDPSKLVKFSQSAQSELIRIVLLSVLETEGYPKNRYAQSESIGEN